MEQHVVQKLEDIKKTLTNVKEQIALAMDTCCFASVDLDYDEFDLLTRELESVIREINEVKSYEGGSLLESPQESMERKT